MNAAVKHLVEEAQRLTPEDREELVGTLLSRSEPDLEWTDALVVECDRRMEDVRSGKSKLIPEEEAHRRIRQALSDIR